MSFLRRGGKLAENVNGYNMHEIVVLIYSEENASSIDDDGCTGLVETSPDDVSKSAKVMYL